ncbi:MAG: AAA domain-containing protein [Endozoicomonadaceae bacterium]|nr:AAA domain-containing protein [Endozoicomonadaceae bacterium]
MSTDDVLNNQQIHSPDEKDKAVRLTHYLQGLTNLRTKSIQNVKDYEEIFWISDCPHEPECFTQAWGYNEEPQADEWIKVQNRKEPKLPAVPVQCKEWADPESLENKRDQPTLIAEINREIPNPDWCEDSDQPKNILQTERLENHPEVSQAWDRYIEEKWLPWTEKHNAWEKVFKAYSKLYKIHQKQHQLGDEYQLVLGLGLLIWQTPGGQRIRRHLIVADATLEFAAGQGKFTVHSHTEGAKLRYELDMLDIEERPKRAEKDALTSLQAAEEDPWNKSCIEATLKALVHSIDAHGDYDESLEAKNTSVSTKPIVKYAPALILRKRSIKGFAKTLQQISEKIENNEAIPDQFADLAEISPQQEYEDGAQNGKMSLPDEIFFPMPANDAQKCIVKKMHSANGVLVQGPPGTGKSHTIANLICHLLATGQRTLITAKTASALQVLKKRLPEELRPLCIDLLGNGPEERRSLESSVGGILRKHEEWNESHAEQERTGLKERLRKLREEKAKINRRLCCIREAETHKQSIAQGAYQGTAARIAEAVNKDQARYKWFTDSVPLDQTCPLVISDLQKIPATLRRFTPEKRRELNLEWPDTLPSPDDFASLIEDEAKAIKEEQSTQHEADKQLADLLANNDPAVIEAIRDNLSSLQNTCRKLFAMPHLWTKDALRDILGGNSYRWHELLRATDYAITSTKELVAIADETRLEFSEDIDIRSLHEDARILKEYMENGGKLGFGVFRPKVVKERLYVIKSVKMSGRLCSTAEDFSRLADALHVRIEIEKLISFWKVHDEKIEGPYSFQLTALKSLCDALKDILALKEVIARCQETINKCAQISEPVWSDESEITKIVASCRFAQIQIGKQLIAKKIHNIEMPISSVADSGNAHPLTEDLYSAICNRDANEFARCAKLIEDLQEQRQHLQNMDKYLSNLRRLLPALTDSLQKTCDDSQWEARLHCIENTWRWAQAKYWIEEYIRKEDMPALNERTKQIENDINATIAKLAALHAWSFCFSRLREDHCRSMEAWQQSMGRLGKGTGKHAAHHRREAQKYLNQCREAVPAWVMPLHRVWDTVSPAPGMFDVIIIDEASQCNFEALPLLYLGKKILIVGDDKQISPDAVGSNHNTAHQLMEKYLHDFHLKSQFDIAGSLFDQGKLRYSSQRITLQEHFRCMPEIIRFSNDLCYRDTPLIPLRQYNSKRLQPLDHVFVENGYREGSGYKVINQPEAEAIVDRIVQMCADSQYDEKTMGVVVLQGKGQAALIQDLLLKQLGAKEIERRSLICGDPSNFQGDERDIIFLSLVAATNERFTAMTKSADEQRFNVAASRARDMMILFHSVRREDLSESCLRRKLLDFFENRQTQQIDGIDKDELERRAFKDNRTEIKPPAPFDSWFEVDVALEIMRKNFTILPQYEVAGKRIDLVVEGGQARLAVECDGDHWHGADRYEADMQRQRQLERCGWEFFRIRESAFYANQESALAGLWHTLEERGILANPPYRAIPFEEAENLTTFDADNSKTTGDNTKNDPTEDSEGNPGHSNYRTEEMSTV